MKYMHRSKHNTSTRRHKHKQTGSSTHTRTSHKLHFNGKGTALIGTDNKEAKLATTNSQNIYYDDKMC
jgi:hypothetical protein